MISDKHLLEPHLCHEPTVAATGGRSSLVAWAERALLQSEIASARELAGLSDDELTHLENEFSRCPKRPRPAWERDAVPLGIALLLLAGFAFAAPEHLVRLSDFNAQLARIAGAVLVVLGVLALSARYVASLTGAPLDRTYSTLGLYVSQLQDRHPWLYETLRVARHEAADEYRCKVLNERGLLRGADYVLMCEIVRVHEALDRARPANFVVEALQLLPAPPPPAGDGAGAEPRLVPIGAGRRGQA
jgi:hypothetical protein